LQSMTKPVIAACAMSLYDEGKFTLDEPIFKHCPEWKEPKVLENGQLVSAKYAITPRMLMSHSSGLYYGDIEKGALSKKGNQIVGFVPVATTNRGAKTTLKEFSEGLAKAPLKFHPGTGYQYGHSIDVLGRYIEAVAGKPLDEVMKERILNPLAMADTDFWAPPERIGRVAMLYTQPAPGQLARGRGPETVAAKPSLFLGGQGLLSTAADYARFAQMLLARGELDGVRVLARETAEMMYHNHLPAEAGRPYGLGGAVDLEGGYTWGGANGTQFWIDTANDMFVVFMVQTQRYRSGAYPEFNRLVRGLLEDPVGEVGLGVNRSGLGQPEAPRRGPAPGGLFERLDTNGDGKLSRDESPDPALFDRLDADHDGFVTRDELVALGSGGRT